MSRVLRPNYAQRFLLPPALDEWVPLGHPVRFVSDFVDALDLPELGIAEPAAQEGRPPFAPDLVLKIWLFGYMERIRSPRRLEKACLEIMPFLWLTGRLHPDHNTLWRFFDKNRKALPGLFKQLVKMAAEAELIGFALHALDGTKMTAASSTDEALHRKSLDEKLKLLDELIATYMQEVNAREEADKGQGYAMPPGMADGDARRARIRELLARRIENREDAKLLEERSEGTPGESAQTQLEAAASTDEGQPGATTEPGATSTGEAKPEAGATQDAAAPSDATNDEQPAAELEASQDSTEPAVDPLLREAEALKKELMAKRDKLDEAQTNHLHEGEPEARMMKGRGTHALGYNAQVVVDHDSDLIVAFDVVADQNDLAQLVPMLDHVRETLGRVADQSVADTGYANGEQLKSAELSETNVIVALREEPDAKGEYSKAYFRYDAESDVYVCPQNEKLVQIGTNKSHMSQQHPDVIYRCHNTTCPVRAQCTKEVRGRKIRRPYGEDARERQAAKQQDPRMRLLLSLRKEIVEHLFGIVKGVDGFRRFTVRGLEKVNAQWALVCAAVNLRKLYAMATWKGGALVRLSLAPDAAAAGGPAT